MEGVTIEGVPRGGVDESSGKGFGGCIYNQVGPCSNSRERLSQCLPAVQRYPVH